VTAEFRLFVSIAFHCNVAVTDWYRIWPPGSTARPIGRTDASALRAASFRCHGRRL